MPLDSSYAGPINLDSIDFSSINLGERWDQAEHGQLYGQDNILIYYAALRQDEQSDAILINIGRAESVFKYWPLVEELFQHGYSIYIWDHRGQGLSGRLLANRHKGHVNHFDDYVEDMQTVYSDIVQPYQHQHHYVLAHSMGAAICVRYFEQFPRHFDACVFSAPMFEIDLPIPKWLLNPISIFLNALKPKGYAPTGTDYKPLPFESNPLTSNRERHAQFQQLNQQYPALQLGSPSNRWLRQSLLATKRIQKTRVTVPCLVLQAECEQIVDNEVQNRFCQKDDIHRLIQLKNARHELLMETDAIRQQAINASLNWFQLHRRTDSDLTKTTQSSTPPE